MTQTVVIGLDGGCWPLVEQWIDDGHLPTLKQLREEGAWGISESYRPPVTCPNWKCYATGKNPGKLGVYWWERIDTETRSMTLPDATDFKSPELWDYLNDADRGAGVINLPMSYPPRAIDDFVIAGGPRSRETGYTAPEELESELQDRFGYRVHPENVLTTNEDAEAEVEMVYDLLRTRLRTAKTMLAERDIEFLHLTLFHLNVLQHYFWDGIETRRAWELIDDALREFVDGDFNLVLVSDHGCTEIDTVFYINSWLESQGYLTTTSSLSGRLYDIGLTQERVAALVRRIGLERYLRPLIPRQVIERFPTSDGVVREEKLSMIDWENTSAIASGQGLVYVVADDPSERATVRSALIDDLEAATGANGSPIADAVYRREELYDGPYVDQAPDIVVDQRPGVHISEAMGQDEAVTSPSDWRAENVPDGMVVCHGDDIRPQSLGRCRISDVAPTLLHWLGLAVPNDMDGTVLSEAFDPESEPGQRAVEYREPLPERGNDRGLTQTVENRLEQIGYLE